MGALRTLELAGEGWGGVGLKLQSFGQWNGFAARRLQRVFGKFCPGPPSDLSPGEARRPHSGPKALAAADGRKRRKGSRAGRGLGWRP